MALTSYEELFKTVLTGDRNPWELAHLIGDTEEDHCQRTRDTLEKPTNNEVTTDGIESMLCFLICNRLPLVRENSSLKEYIKSLAHMGPKKVCQLSFKRNDIVWICKTCQKDETCVLCNVCFRDSTHDGHEVYFYHAQAGGCCDCGDADAWNPEGFCSVHGKVDPDPTRHLNPLLVSSSRAVLSTTVSSLIQTLQHCRISIEVIRHTVFRYARWRSERKSGIVTDDSRHREKLKLIIEMLHDEELAEVVLHWNETTTKVDVVAAIFNTSWSGTGNSQLIAETKANQCQEEGYVALKDFSCEVWKAAFSACESEEAFIQLDPSSEAYELLEGLDKLVYRDMIISIRPRNLKVRLERAKPVVSWLEMIARSCDGMKRLVCEAMDRTKLTALFLVDAFAPKRIGVSLHALYLELMADEFFKLDMSRCYINVYRGISHRFVRGIGLTDNSLYTLSVQFLNREKFVTMLSEEHALLSVLARTITDSLAKASVRPVSVADRLKSLNKAQLKMDKFRSDNDGFFDADDSDSDSDLEVLDDGLVDQVLEAAAEEDIGNQISSPTNPSEATHPLHCAHAVLLHRRYAPAISDLKCVLNVPGVSRKFCVDPPHDVETEPLDEDRRLRRRRQRDCLGLWTQALAYIQGMDPLTRVVSGAHVEFESRDWMNSFNVNISLCSCFDHLVGWLRTAGAESTNAVQDMLHRIAEHVFDWNSNNLGEPRWCVIPVQSWSTGRTMRVWCDAMLSRPSFHAALLRFFSHSITESTRSTSLSPVLSHLVSALSSQPKAIGLVEMSLSVLVMAAQVRVGMWRRNGQSMMDQLMNYSEAPFCRLFRDPDLHMLQFGALCYPSLESLEEGPDDGEVSVDNIGLFVNHVMHRFDCLDCFMGGGMDALDDLVVEQRLGLAEEMLHLLIIFSTEMPLPPQGEYSIEYDYGNVDYKDKDLKMLAAVRKEMIHQLAQAPCVHSEAHEAYALVTRCDNIGPDLLDAILDDIAECRPGVGLEPEKYLLRHECWGEYDPCFFHLTARSHQSAVERRPIPSGPSTQKRQALEEEARRLESLLDASPEARTRYASVISELSFRNNGSEKDVAAPIVGPPLPAHPLFADLRSGVLTDLSLLKFLGRTLESAVSPNSSDFTCTGTLLSRSLHLLTLALHTVATLPSSHPHRTRLFSTLLKPISASASQVSFIKSVQLLLDTSWCSDASVGRGARWLINMAGALHTDVAASVVAARTDQSPSSLESRKAAAKARALAAISAQANSFMSAFEDSQEEDEDGPVTSDVDFECIICREQSDSPMGYLGFAQLSRCLPSGGRHCARRCGITITCCGHTLHEDCYDTYFATTIQNAENSISMIASLRNGGIGHTALDLSRGELQCPLCKRVANLLVPAVTPTQPQTKAVDQASQSSEKMVSWLRAQVEEKLVITDLGPDEADSTGMPSAIVSSFMRNLYDLSQCTNSLTDLDSWRCALPPAPLKELMTACWALSYSVSCHIVERDLTAQEATESGFDKQEEHLRSVAQGVWKYAQCSKTSESLSQDLRGALSTTETYATPLLSRNMLETLTATLLIPSAASDFSSAIMSMYLARLVQLLWAELSHLSMDASCGEELTDEERTMVELTQVIRSELECYSHIEAAAEGNSGGDRISGSGDGHSSRFDSGGGGGGGGGDRRGSRGDSGGDALSETDKLRVGFSNVHKAMKAFDFAAQLIVQLIHGTTKEYGVPNQVNQAIHLAKSPELRTSVRSWVRKALTHSPRTLSPDYVHQMVKRMGSDYPWGDSVRLTSLPNAYTELHLSLTQRLEHIQSEKELRPALCLLCGDALDADGKGNCTAHIEQCGLGVGMFFLLQDCTIVLMHGPRASYLPTPYVDDHGERHGQYRGRPLYLNAARVEHLRSLVANHKIPSSVVGSRSTSHKVIISGYY